MMKVKIILNRAFGNTGLPANLILTTLNQTKPRAPPAIFVAPQVGDHCSRLSLSI